MFAPTFVQHRGARILRLDYSELAPADLVFAADQVRRVVTAEPPGSVRTLTILYSQLTADTAAALKRAALANAPHIRASAMVGSSFWRVIAADVQAHGREDLTLFEDEASAIDWLAAQ